MGTRLCQSHMVNNAATKHDSCDVIRKMSSWQSELSHITHNVSAIEPMQAKVSAIYCTCSGASCCNHWVHFVNHNMLPSSLVYPYIGGCKAIGEWQFGWYFRIVSTLFPYKCTTIFVKYFCYFLRNKIKPSSIVKLI